MFAMEHIWNIQQHEMHQLINHKSKDLVNNEKWNYCFDNNGNERAIFEGHMVAGFNDNDTNQQGKETMIGLYWILKSIPNGYSSVKLDIEIYCPQIEFYIQMFDINMAFNSNSNDAGHSSLFPMSQISNFNTFTWRIIIKPRLVK